MDNSALVRKDGRYRSLLAGVGIEHQELIVRWNPVELSRIGVRLFCSDRGLCLTVTCDCGDDVVYWKIVCTLLQILHHRHLLKREVPQYYPQPDLEAPCIGHQALDLSAEALYVKNGTFRFLTSELSQEFLRLQLDRELVLQHVQKHEVELKASRRGKVIGVAAFLLTDGDRQQ